MNVTLTGKRIKIRCSYTDGQNESIWYAETESGLYFTLYSNDKTGQVQLHFFSCKHKTKDSLIPSETIAEALQLLCEHVSSKSGKNAYLIVTRDSSSRVYQICRKAGLKTRKGGPTNTFYYNRLNVL